jgi:hypothetical protein
VNDAPGSTPAGRDRPDGPVDPASGSAADLSPGPSPDEVTAERARSRRSVSFIVAVVVACVVAIGALALWVAAVPYDVEAPLAGTPVACDATLDAGVGPSEIAAWDAACDRAEDEARTDRRNTALVLGVGAFVVATAVSTWPSRRLTGERLGPLR